MSTTPVSVGGESLVARADAIIRELETMDAPDVLLKHMHIAGKAFALLRAIISESLSLPTPPQGEGKQQGEATKFKHWCETCEGLGYYDSTLGCDSRLGNRKQECPDCDGRGYWEARGGDEGMVLVPREPTPEMVEAICANHTKARWPRDFGSSAQGIRRDYARAGYIAALAASPVDGRKQP